MKNINKVSERQSHC